MAEQDDNFSLDLQVRCLNVGFLYIIYHQSPTNTLRVFRDEVFCLRIMIFQKKFETVFIANFEHISQNYV